MRRCLTLYVLALALALPSAAMAQSAGDNQYADPFGSTPPSSQPRSNGSGSSGGGHTDAAAPARPTATAGSGQAAAAAPSAGTSLPRTGLGAFELVVTGALAIAAGLALRLALRRVASRS